MNQRSIPEPPFPGTENREKWIENGVRAETEPEFEVVSSDGNLRSGHVTSEGKNLGSGPRQWTQQ